MEEIWKDIKGYEQLYQISNLGRVKSLGNGKTHNTKIHILKNVKDTTGYNRVSLSKDGVAKNYNVHRLVAEAFISNPDNLPCINHKNERKDENFVWINEDGTIDLEKSNLEWCTYEYNIKYSNVDKKAVISRIGSKHTEMTKQLISDRLKNNRLSKPVIQYDLEGNYIKEWPSAREVQRVLGWHSSLISRCCRGEGEYCHNYKWKYKNVS